MSAGPEAPAAVLGGLRGALFPFAPVVMGVGTGLYFARATEPGAALLALLAALALALVAAGLRTQAAWRPLAFGLALALAGFCLAALRSHLVAAPVLTHHRYGPVEGRIVAVDRSASGALRLTLDRPALPGLEPEAVPARLRLTVPEPLGFVPQPGTRVMTTAHLDGPAPPVEPGGFDFRRHAWFERLGALGYTRSPVLALADPAPGDGPALALARLRRAIAETVRARLPGEAGGFVAALLTGDRSGVGPETTEALRRANLSHLLAISGLHMALLTATVFALLRALLAAWPRATLYLPARKLAALGALAAAGGYLALSGGSISTQRAFVMAAAMLGAVLAERRVFSPRSVALAALVLLAWRPEALLSAGFQMSFAATVALVATFAALRARGPPGPRGRGARLAAPVVSAVICALVAGIATAPYAAAAFHRAAVYGLLANLLSVPLMGLLVMPAAVLAAALWPLGLSGVGLALMELGARWILGVAQRVGGLEGAVVPIPAAPGWVLPLFTLGALWGLLWPRRARWAGLAAVALAFAGWSLAARPSLLIDRDGALVGLMGAQGRALSRARGAGYAAQNWLEADGDGARQAEAAARPGFAAVEGGVRFSFAGESWLHLWGARGEAALAGACRDGLRIVTDRPARLPPGAACRVIDPPGLARSGALAIAAAGAVREAQAVSGRRPWTAP